MGNYSWHGSFLFWGGEGFFICDIPMPPILGCLSYHHHRERYVFLEKITGYFYCAYNKTQVAIFQVYEHYAPIQARWTIMSCLMASWYAHIM